jgi:hypothetical protein
MCMNFYVNLFFKTSLLLHVNVLLILCMGYFLLFLHDLRKIHSLKCLFLMACEISLIYPITNVNGKGLGTISKIPYAFNSLISVIYIGN